MLTTKLGEHTTLKILAEPQDHLKWHKLIEYVKAEQELEESFKDKIIEAYYYLDKTLGKKFLNNCQKNSPQFAQYFLNKAPWALDWVASFSHTLKVLKTNNLDKYLIAKLNSKKKFHEGIVFLELYNHFNKKELTVSFEPIVKVENKYKSPDIKLLDNKTKEELYIEVSDLQISDEDSLEKNPFHKMASALSHVKGILACGRISKFKESEFVNLLEITQMAFTKALNENKLVVLNKHPFFIGIAPENARQELSVWAKENGFSSGGFSGDSQKIGDPKEIIRLKNKIQREAKQLSKESNNLVIIRINPIAFIKMGIIEAIQEIEKELVKYSHLIGVLFYTDFCLKDIESTIRFNNHQTSIRVKHGANRQTYIYIHNNHYVSNLSKKMMENIYNAFTFGEIKDM